MTKPRNTKSKEPLKLLQGGKPKEKVHPFANFMDKKSSGGPVKPHTHQQTLHPQIPRKKAV